jgi:hypothetical protein
MTVRIIAPALLLAGAAVLSAVGSASAASNATMTNCFEQYQSEKDAGTLPKGEIWTKFYSDCAARLKKGKVTATTAQVKKTKKAAAKLPPAVEDKPGYVPQEPTVNDQTAAIPTKDASGKSLSASEIAFRRRIKECGNEWRQDKAKGTLPSDEKWPHFWSACNTRLKNQG